MEKKFEEFKKVLKAQLYSGDAKKLFNLLDSDKNGTITWQEFKRMMDDG